MAERLQVIRNGVVVAYLDRRDDGRLALTYADRAVDVAGGQVLLSASIPVRRQPYEEAALQPFFEGLLPEGLVRERLATRLRLDPTDVFGLLREIGLECAGAYSIVPDGFDLTVAREEGVEWLSEEQLAEEVRQLAARPLAVEPDKDIRISLAGAQDKMAVVLDAGRIGLPRGLAPSTHVLKPASQVVRASRRRRQLAYPALVNNEAFCMRLSRLAGLRTASVELVQVGGEPALLVERYDRERDAEGHVSRIHQEDFCQALGFPSRLKYEKDGGPGLGDYLDLLARTSSGFDADGRELIDRAAFNYLVGNADAHAKNFSILYGEEVRLAPAYDVLSTYVYGHLSHDMATSINGMFDGRAIQSIHWQKELIRLGLNERYYAQRLVEVADRVEHVLPTVTAWVDENGLGDRRLRLVASVVRDRARVLRQVHTLPARSPRGRDVGSRVR